MVKHWDDVKEFQLTAARRRLASLNSYDISLSRFNSQPPEGGWFLTSTIKIVCKTVSTHSRPKAAGPLSPRNLLPITPVSTHSRPKAAGGCQSKSIPSVSVSTHSRPKAAGKTAEYLQIIRDVSTHSRPKAAGLSDFLIRQFTHGFNSQPPEGGWVQLDGYM